MRAFHERGSSDNDRDHGRKRPRVSQGPRGHTPSQPTPPSASSPFQQNIHTTTSSTESMAPAPMSFEAKIALALQGNNWQALQNSISNVIAPQPQPSQDGPVQEGVALDPEVVEDDANKPPEMTAKQKKKKERFDRTIARDAGKVLQTIEPDSIIPVQQEVTWNQDPELLCSYNWQASTDDTNTIFVPGEPAKWQPPTLPHTLDKDTGFQYADYNYARQPRQPYEPMFQALRLMNPDYQFMDTDVLADRNNLRVLLEFVQGRANGPLRLDLYLIFNTLVIVRNEHAWWKFSDGKSYGCNFERFFTRPTEGMEDATSHYRAIRYPMGGLNVVVRFEADAYDDGVEAGELGAAETQAVSGGLAERPTFKFSAPIRVLQKGHVVPTAQMVELKTQAYHPDAFKLVACQDQLWFGRTSLLYTGPYEPGTGVVSRLRYEDATQRIKTWEENNQENLRKLVALLALLRAVVKKDGGPNRAVVLVREDKGGPLTVRSMTGMHRAVGRDAFQKHWRRGPQQFAPQFGGYGGQRGGGRGYHTAPRGDGYAGRGAFGRGGGYGGGNYTASHGHGYVDGGRGGGPAARGRGSGYERGGYGRGEPHVRRPNY